MVNNTSHDDDLGRLLTDWCAKEAQRPVRTTPGMLRLKAELAQADQRRAAAARIERWGFGLVGVLFLVSSLTPAGQLIGAGQSLAAFGGLGVIVLAGAGWSFARALQA